MGYTMLKNKLQPRKYDKNSLETAAIKFIRESCEGLRFDKDKVSKIKNVNFSSIDFTGDSPKYKDDTVDFEGASIKKNQIPYNMEKDIDRLCLENAIARFLKSGKKEDAFDVYFCYLEMFVGDYEKTRRMIELLSEFEANGSGLLMKHRDHYSHSVYVFTLGLAIYESNENFRKVYKEFYKIVDDNIVDDNKTACHYLRYWGLASLFHDIGYPFELPFEQVASYFEIGEDDKKKKKIREGKPFVAYNALDEFVKIDEKTRENLKGKFTGKDFSTTNELFAYLLADKLGSTYNITEEDMKKTLEQKATEPNEFNYYMDHAYFSATVLFNKLFSEMGCELTEESLDSITAILMHNSLYKFSIAHYKGDNNIPFKANLHPLAFMLMLCDELQCWDRTAYGRDSKKQLHPMGCTFDFSDNKIKAVYLFDEGEVAKIDTFKDAYIEWLQKPKGDAPELKAYSEMYIKENGISNFQGDIEKIVDLTDIKLSVETGIAKKVHEGNRSYLSSSNFINLYNFAIVLNGRWQNREWKKAKNEGQEEKFLSDKTVIEEYTNSFKDLSLEYKLSNINQAKAFARYLNEIGCFYTDKEVDFDIVDSFSKEELLKIGFLEHQRWLQEHYDMGWIYGEPGKAERDFLRRHMDMIPEFDNQFPVNTDDAKNNYDRLNQDEKDKDTDPMECMLALLRMYDGLRIYRL